MSNQSEKLAVFRADASVEIGTGHVMRCLTLAGALNKAGFSIAFVCRDFQGNLIRRIESLGYAMHRLPAKKGGVPRATSASDYGSWLGCDWQTDASQTLECLGDSFVDVLVVDHYAIDWRWERDVQRKCHYVLVIDDLANRRHHCDALLDQNIGSKVKDYTDLVNADCNIIVGPQYSLLRPQFAMLREISLARRLQCNLEHLLICVGGVDSSNLTESILDILLTYQLPLGMQTTVVLGETAPWIKSVEEKVKEFGGAVRLMIGVDDMAGLMSESDLAIGAAGSTALERCCMGLPSIVLVVADNQRKIGVALDKANAAILVNSSDFESELKGALSKVFNSASALSEMSKSAAELTNGQGVDQLLYNILGDAA